MSSPNLRHFRVFLAVAELRSPTLASERCRVSQPAVTQSLGKLERKVSGTLFKRTRQGFFLTERGNVFEARIRRAMERLDTALADVSPRLTVTATTSQLQALIAMTEAQNFTLAARALDLAQPSVGNFWQADLEEMPWLRSRT
jgi:DNA-binding transcriptional LysR family regulator